jgi:polysaccharide pyruvyl transferase WcaK-like protein
MMPSDYGKFIPQDIKALHGLLRGDRITPYIGLVGYNNLGDDLLISAHEKLFPEMQLSVYRKESALIEYLASVFGRHYSEFAVLGGGTLINRQHHWIDRVERLVAKKKMFCMGTGVANPGFWQGDNSIGGRTFQRWVRALEAFEYVGVRGPVSKEILEQGGLRGVEVIGDTALCLADDSADHSTGTGVIGLCYGDVVDPHDNPMWGDSNTFRRELVAGIKSLIANGARVKLLLIRKEDLPSNQKFIEQVNDPRCTLEVAYDSYEKYSSLVKECDLFIGQKLHSTVIALINRVPSLMLEYRPKCRDFMASLGLENYVIRTSDFNKGRFLTLFEELAAKQNSYLEQAENRILEFKQMQFRRALEIRQVLLQ